MVASAGLIVITSTLGEGLGGHFTGDAVLDGEGLYSCRVIQGECCTVQVAGGGWRAAIRGVANLGTVRAGDAHLGALLKRSGTTDHGSVYGLGLRAAAAGIAVTARATLARGGVISALAAGFTGFPLGLGQHGAGLLAGAAVDEVVAEEDLGRSGTGSAVLGQIVGTDVNGRVIRLLDHLDGDSLAVSAGNAVGLAFRSLDDQEDASVVGEVLIQLEGKDVALGHDGGAGGRLHTHQCGRVDKSGTAAGNNPVVEPGEQVAAGNLGFGTKDRTPLLRKGQLVPGEDLGARERLPLGGQLLENALNLSLVRSADRTAVTAVADVLAALHLSGSNALGAAAHLLEGDGRNVLHEV